MPGVGTRRDRARERLPVWRSVQGGPASPTCSNPLRPAPTDYSKWPSTAPSARGSQRATSVSEHDAWTVGVSPTYRATYLYAMRFVVAVISDKDTLGVYGTSCQVVVVYKDKRYDDPTVVCGPITLNRPIRGS